MKFVVSSSSLLKATQLASGVISTNTVLPILEDFLFEINKKELKISASDLETSIAVSIEVEANTSGTVAVPSRILLDTLKSLPEQPVTFDVNEKTNAIELTSNNGKYKLAGDNGEEFPKIPDAEDISGVQLPAGILSNAIEKTIFAVSNDELRPAMTGVLFQFSKDGATFVATDAHKLVKITREDTVSDDSTSFIVPKKALNLLKNALSDNDTKVQLDYNRSSAFFTFDNIRLVCRLIDAKYPDYSAVIPKDNPNTLNIDRSDLLNSLRRISIYANKTTHQVLLKIAGSQLTVSAQDLDFSNEATERLNCEYNGDDIEIGFNARFLIEMLNTLDGDEVKMELSTSTRAGILLPSHQAEKEHILMLVMPVMLNA